MPILAGRYEYEISAEVIMIFKYAAMGFVKVCKLFALSQYLAAEGKSRMKGISNSTIISCFAKAPFLGESRV